MGQNKFNKPEDAAKARPPANAAGPTQELVSWNEESMGTGVATIDEQHRELIAKINELARLHREGATVDDIKAMLKFLGKYAQEHFAYEEKLMEQFKCPTKQTNCTAHARFLDEYKELVSNFSMEQDPDETAGKIERMAARWLVAHICRVDVGLREGPQEQG